MIRGVTGAIVGAVCAWAVLSVAGIIEPDPAILTSLAHEVLGLIQDAIRWVAGAAAYPARAGIIIATVCGFVIGLRGSK